VISPDNKYFFFNPETMKPLINSEGHLRALEHYAKFLPTGPKEAISWTLGQGWNLFLSGNAVLEPTWGDLPTFAQEEDKSKVRGKMGAAPIPGTSEAFDPISGKWQKYDFNQVGNTNGGSWHCVISRFSKKKEATYDFLAFMANKKNAFFNTTHGFTGVQPGVKLSFFPDGTGTLEEWVSRVGTQMTPRSMRLLQQFSSRLRWVTASPARRNTGTSWMSACPRSWRQTTAKAALDDTYKHGDRSRNAMVERVRRSLPGLLSRVTSAEAPCYISRSRFGLEGASLCRVGVDIVLGR
jgi:ABC-type glycerol-3-phosphate transport system substrate-binding protein